MLLTSSPITTTMTPMDKQREAEARKTMKDKPKLGRPRLPAELDTRHQIRCSQKDVDAWEAHAEKLGYVGSSAWIRKTLNDALKQGK